MLRRAIGSLTRHWFFSGAVVLLVALGASVAIVMLSFAEAVLFRPLAVPRPEQLVRVVLMTRETLVVVLAGIVIGLAAARACASVLQPMLFATSATNPVTALVTAAVVLVATLAATAGPIGRVARLAPAPVLRE